MSPPAELISWPLALAVSIAALAGVVRGFTGFGSSMMMAPLFALAFGPVSGVATVVLTEMAVTAQLIPGAVREVHWREVLPMGAAASLAVPFGGYVLITAEPELMRRAIALVVLAFALVMLAGWRYRGTRPLPLTLGVGVVSGAMLGSVGMAGPPVILYLLSGPDAAARNRANIIIYFALTSVVVTLTLILNGAVDGASLWRAVAVTPVFMAGAWLGGRLFSRASEALYRRAALYLLLIIALATLVV